MCTAEQAMKRFNRLGYLLSKEMLCMNDIDYIVYRDEFETMTEYNGFLIEV